MRFKFIFPLAFVCLTNFATAANADDHDAVSELPAPIEKIFIPYGFDDNDNVEIVLHGHFPDTCYQVGQSSAKVDEVNRKITVRATALHYPEGRCVKAPIPFIQTVRVGLLQSGDYEVDLEGSTLTSALAVLPRTTESPEDYLYAPVTSATLTSPKAGEAQILTLRGQYPYMFIGCMKITEVRLTQAQDDLLVVQPISEIFPDGECEDMPENHEFAVKREVPKPLLGDGVIHVRVLSGDSLNQLVPMRR